MDVRHLVAAAADLCRKPLRHGVVLISDPEQEQEDCSLRIEARSPEGERRREEDLEVEIYRSGKDLHLTLAWAEPDHVTPSLQGDRPMLWQGSHPVWMSAHGERCERPEGGVPLEALARRLRALLAVG